MSNKREVFLILHDIRSAHNVGAIFRTAETAGISKIYLTGYTPAPIDQFDRERKDVAKTALGAEKIVPWEAYKNIKRPIKELKEKKFMIIAAEQSPKSIDYKKVKIKNKTAIILGNEVTGLPANVLENCDIAAQIPMKGKKESLNVSVAAGIFIFRAMGI